MAALPVRNIRLDIQYDGTNYHGWQRQPNVRTIQAEIEAALEKLTERKVHITGASRTDTGVHALGQTANFHLKDSPIPTENLQNALNSILPDDIVIKNVREMPIKFNAIASAQEKHYRYTICTAPIRPVMQIRYCWHFGSSLDTEAMDKAAKLLIGQHDFRSFASSSDTRKSSVRTLTHCQVSKDGDWVWFDIKGSAFLYHMVRNITGTLVEIGRGRWDPDQMTDILNAKQRSAAGPTAPAAGLCLMHIDYGKYDLD